MKIHEPRQRQGTVKGPLWLHLWQHFECLLDSLDDLQACADVTCISFEELDKDKKEYIKQNCRGLWLSITDTKKILKDQLGPIADCINEG